MNKIRLVGSRDLMLLHFTVIVALLAACSPTVENPADLAISGGPILTMVGDAPQYVEAVAVDDGVIVYAGDAAGLADFVGDGTEQKERSGFDTQEVILSPLMMLSQVLRRLR